MTILENDATSTKYSKFNVEIHPMFQQREETFWNRPFFGQETVSRTSVLTSEEAIHSIGKGPDDSLGL